MSALDTILALPKVIHDLEQGSEAWHAFRLEHDGASEAAAMLGLSKNVTRNELLHAKHTGLPREFSDFVQTRVLAKGHEVEALARPHVEAELGEDLYPVTCSRGCLSASCDGLTLDDSTALEHKQWNDELAAIVRAGVVPDDHMPQCQQILLVTGAQRVNFVVSDGTRERMVSAIVTPDRGWWERIANGWEQFHKDRAAYVPTAHAPAVVAEPVQALPAVVVQVTGSISLTDNFKAFETALRDFLEHRLIRAPKTDQDFADLDVQIKAMKGAEAALEAAEGQMLAQVQSIDSAKKTKDMLHKLVRDNRLMAEKLLTSEKERRRAEIVLKARSAYEAHVEALKVDTGGPWITLVAPDFAGKVKGLRTIASIQNAVDTELANAKIIADASARQIRAALACIAEEGKGYEFLLADRLGMVHRPVEDLRVLIRARITEHKAAEERKEAARREEIRQEEIAKLQREQEARDREAARQAAAAAAPTLPPAAAPVAAPASVSQAPAANSPTVVPIRGPDSTATIRLGQINERLAPIQITAEGLATLGFQSVGKDRSAVLYRLSDFALLCEAIAVRAHAAQAKHQFAA